MRHLNPKFIFSITCSKVNRGISLTEVLLNRNIQSKDTRIGKIIASNIQLPAAYVYIGCVWDNLT